MPLLTVASAISRMSLSLTLQPNLFQPSHPIGGVGARDADVCADVAGARWAAKVPTRRQAGSARIKENHRKFIFPRNIGYVTAYAESSTQRQKVRCYSTRQKNSPALAYAAHKISTAFDQDKCATGVRTLPAHTESNRRTMTFLPSKFLPALLLMPVLFALCGAAQEPEDRKPQKPESMGVATGNPHAPVKDALSRPIAAGGFVDGAPVVFVDVTKQAGLDKFRHRSGGADKATILETPGSGVALIDYDNDGLLVLLVPGYVKFDADHPPIAGQGGIPASACQFRGVNFLMCGPRGLPGESDHLFHNNGDGTFTDVSKKAGVSDPQGYYGLASVFVDVDDDGWVDLVVANDSVPRCLYRNLHDGTFEDVSYLSGFALTNEGLAQASMGIAVGDYNRDGRVDFLITTFSDDYKTLYRNDGNNNFSDVTYRAGLGTLTIPLLTWVAGFVDFDNDGLPDIFVANGHVYPSVDQRDWGTTWAERPQLFRNLDGVKFQEVPPATGSGLADVTPARGAAFGDLFNDGHMDVVLNNMDCAPTLLRNVVKNNNHWITLKLVGGPKSPRDAVGAKVFLSAGAVRQRADVISGASYGSSSDQRVHFGLGAARKVDKLEIHWPSGKREEIVVPGVDRILTAVEGQGVVEK